MPGGGGGIGGIGGIGGGGGRPPTKAGGGSTIVVFNRDDGGKPASRLTCFAHTATPQNGGHGSGWRGNGL
jgi:hypothetical protein